MDKIVQSLSQFGITFDEGPHLGQPEYMQSNRLEIYQHYADKLMEVNRAYKCYCPRENSKGKLLCNRRCLENRNSRCNIQQNYSVRFLINHSANLAASDTIFGKLHLDSSQIEQDPVIIKSDGFPTYHFASVIDDHLMKITNVLRGQEWLPTLPIHAQIYDSFEWKMPTYSHLPLLIDSGGKKLSKRTGSVSVDTLLAKGYLPEALVNFVAMLGWNPGNGSTKEIYSMQELIADFSLDGLNKSSSIVNFERLEWFNKTHYALQCNTDGRAEMYMKAMEQHLNGKKNLIKIGDKEYFENIIRACKGRISTVEKFLSICTPFFVNPEYETTDVQVEMKDLADMICILRNNIYDCENWSEERIKSIINDSAISIPFKQRAVILRQILMNVAIGPPLIDIMHILGKEVVLNRMNDFYNCFEAHHNALNKIKPISG